MKYLVSALLTEGESDEAFLRPVLQNLLDQMALTYEFEAGFMRTSPVRAIDLTARVDSAASVLLKTSDLLFVHRDHRERSKIAALRTRIGAGSRVVAVAPVLETEAWVLAAAFAVKPPGFDVTKLLGPKEIERLADPKAELNRRYGGRQCIEDFFGLLAEHVDVDVLKQLPAYQTFLQDLTTALKELNFS
ncbi:MAG TPA: hypothetical protein VGX23_35260 [Actinocrinis sp.]|nr:hypothetical protein [Actinocrinis sp.]